MKPADLALNCARVLACAVVDGVHPQEGHRSERDASEVPVVPWRHLGWPDGRLAPDHQVVYPPVFVGS